MYEHFITIIAPNLSHIKGNFGMFWFHPLVLYVCLSVCLSVHPPVRLFVCLCMPFCQFSMFLIPSSYLQNGLRLLVWTGKLYQCSS